MGVPAVTAFKATYSDIKLVKTRKVVQFVFEVPVEAADNAMRLLGGMPRPDQEQWVGIAPITEVAATRAPTPAEKPRRAWAETPLVQQAGIRCTDYEFRQWLAASDEQDAIEAVWRICEVKSRTEFATDDVAAEKWRSLDRDFLARPRG